MPTAARLEEPWALKAAAPIGDDNFPASANRAQAPQGNCRKPEFRSTTQAENLKPRLVFLTSHSLGQTQAMPRTQCGYRRWHSSESRECQTRLRRTTPPAERPVARPKRRVSILPRLTNRRAQTQSGPPAGPSRIGLLRWAIRGHSIRRPQAQHRPPSTPGLQAAPPQKGCVCVCVFRSPNRPAFPPA